MPHALRGAAIACAVLIPAALPRFAHAQDDQVAGLTVVSQLVRASGEATPATSVTASAETLSDTVNLTNAEDALRYFPSLLVRKRHVGDTQAPLATRTSGLGSSARSLVYADGVLLSALIGNNNSFASPRWGMVAPEEIARVDVLYGPFSAAYAGNSIGAVVNYTTRMPTRLEGRLTAAASRQAFSQYGTEAAYPVSQIAGELGDRQGALAWRVGENHVESRSQPLNFATVTRPASASAAGTAVTGAFLDRNRTGAPIAVMGAGGLEDQVQDTLRARADLALGARLKLSYSGGLFLNDTRAAAQTYLRDAAGAPVYAGTVNIGGYAYSLPASALSGGVYRLDERHWLHALTAKGAAGAVEWKAVLSRYDYDRDEQRTPSAALPAARIGGTGNILRMDGTGWRTADLTADWGAGESLLSFGAHADLARLASRRYATADWIGGAPGGLAAASLGSARTLALWGQDAWTVRPDLILTLGARYEAWRSYGGLNYSLNPALNAVQPARSTEGLSPKASLQWRPADAWSLTASWGQAYRFPTVSELYQAVTTGPNLSTPDPSLRPERARSAELALAWRDEASELRLSLFSESIRDALISQTGLLSGSSVSFVQNIDTVRTHGLELVFERRDLLPRLDLAGSYTLTDQRIVKDPALQAAEGKDTPG
ncbi:MAG: putative TonB-dependent siderophore receptor, partial [Caulobacteraceae bacterium]|nr:putative TonB-dependent siderophore receptor [Caulobacteraceae bacterium]